MGIVKISEGLHHELRIASRAMTRSINAQAEHWLKVGMLMEANHDITYPQACQLLLEQSRADELRRVAS
ncbi:MAG: hypothetical protein ACI92E_003285 [Oceanicoccus sp.]|jgi:hypothetical protein